MTAALAIIGLTKSYGATPVLCGVDLEVPAGSLTAVLGPSGCGKTTLLRLLAGFDRPDGGRILLDGELLSDSRRSRPPERRHIGYVAQEGALFPHLTVAANIAFGLPWAQRRRHTGVADLLDLVGLDGTHGPRYPNQLSGGEQQRVALARALAAKPAVVLLDEPFSSLDAGLRDSTRRAVADALAARGTTTVLVTHDQGEALSLADQVAVMRDGRLRQIASPATLYQAPVDTETGRFIGDAVILDAKVHADEAWTILGAVSLAEPIAQGPAEVLLRPEQLLVEGTVSAGAQPAVVTRVTFYGHDALVDLRLGDGTAVTARVPGTAVPQTGAQVGVRVRGTAHAFRRPTSTG